MKKLFFLILLAGLFTAVAAAQAPPVELFGEGGDGLVKLLWVPRSWPEGLTAFQVQRRALSGNRRGGWTPVNDTPIFPELSRAKDLSNVESGPAALERLQEKLEGHLSAGSTREVPRQEYLRQLSSDPEAVKGLYLPIALDYDFALLNGFGLVDRGLPPAEGYEYGLFLIFGAQRQEQPVDTFSWQYGAPPNLSLPVELETHTTGTPSRLEIRWTFDYQAYLSKNLNGFNLYRQSGAGSFQKLNETPIWAAAEGDTARLSFFDENVQPNTAYTYALAPLSLFGSEGPRQEVVYDPSELPGEIEPPALQVAARPAGSPGISFEWGFSAAAQSFIRGFVLQRRENVEAPYEDASALLPPPARAAEDVPPRPGEYYFYRLRVVEDHGLNLFSNELLLFYDPQIPPPPPTGLRGSYETEGQQQFIRLEWDPAPPEDTLTAGYRLYSNFPPDERLLLEGNISPITGNSYLYEISSLKSAVYRFAVSAVSKNRAESGLSDTIQVVTPSRKLPNPNIWPFTVEGNRITLNWEYEALPGLAGFRIFQDGELAADENQLGPSARQWASPPLEFDTSYQFELQAVTDTGLTSRMSIARTIRTEKEQ